MLYFSPLQLPQVYNQLLQSQLIPFTPAMPALVLITLLNALHLLATRSIRPITPFLYSITPPFNSLHHSIL